VARANRRQRGRRARPLYRRESGPADGIVTRTGPEGARAVSAS
jgi:hypothetical protein